MPTELLTRKEAAARLRISTGYIDILRRHGKIKPIRIGKRVLFSLKELELFAESCQAAR